MDEPPNDDDSYQIVLAKLRDEIGEISLSPIVWLRPNVDEPPNDDDSYQIIMDKLRDEITE